MTRLDLLKEILKFTLRLTKHLFILICVTLPLQLVGVIILLPVCYVVGPNPLPKYLRWFDNADQYIQRDTSTYFAVRDSGILNMYYWLSIRNPLNYFGYMILGFKQSDSLTTQTFYTGFSSVDVGDSPGKHSGLLYSELNHDNKIYYEYYYINKYVLFDTTYCFRFRLGHKLGFVKPTDEYIQYVTVISPFHSYNGE